MRKRLIGLAAVAALAVGVGVTQVTTNPDPAPAVEASIFGDTGRWFCRRLGLFC